MSDEIRATLLGYIVSRFPAARARKLTDDAPLLDSGVIDSLGILALAEFITRELGIALDDDDLTPENFESVAALATFLSRKRSQP
jgi:acyl carrier protein